MKRHSVKGAASSALRADEKARKTAMTLDSFTNMAQRMGVGADNPLSTATYGTNPITRNRVLLDWIYRGSWLGGVAVDVVADDMTRTGVELKTTLPPRDIESIEEVMVDTQVWPAINDLAKWGRLFGGAIGIILIDGQDPETPFDPMRVGRDSFKGLFVVDRWQVEPTLNNLVTDLGPNMGLPRYYNITTDTQAMPRMCVHYTRVIRFEGVRLPYGQRVMENLWGLSVYERLYDRMIAFDSATMGMAQLVYKSYLRTMKVKRLREVVAAGGKPLEGLMRYTDMMRRFQSIEGVTLIDAEDEYGEAGAQSFSGLSEATMQIGQQLSGALQIPLVRLFGQSPAGLSSSGESDLRTYYDGINQQQERILRVPLTTVYRAAAMSRGITLPAGFRLQFRPLWQLDDVQKAEVAERIVRAVSQAKDEGMISTKGAMKELRQSSQITGVFSNIDNDSIDAAESVIPSPEELAVLNGLAQPPDAEGADPVDTDDPAESDDPPRLRAVK